MDRQEGGRGWSGVRGGWPGGEMPVQVSDRADLFLARLRALDGNIALCSHGHFGCVLAARWIGMAAVEGQHFALGTASLSILGHESNHPRVRVIALWNATSDVTTLPTRNPCDRAKEIQPWQKASK